jgi:hypothetical protein
MREGEISLGERRGAEVFRTGPRPNWLTISGDATPDRLDKSDAQHRSLTWINDCGRD